MTNPNKIKLGVIYGGRSPEHEISIQSAKTVMNAANREKYDIVPLFIDKKGFWDIDNLSSLKGFISIAFPVLHGAFGEDGTIQGMLEMLDIPYIGAGVMASSIGIDKIICKDLLRQNSIPVVDHVAVTGKGILSSLDTIVRECENEIGYPCFVKPSTTGSSVGISKVFNRNELISALYTAKEFSRKILIEKAIDVRELEISVLGNDDPVISIIGEIIPGDDFYSYDAKYSNKESKIITPADINDDQKVRIEELAKCVYKTIDCAGMSRVDFFVDRNTGKIFVNEVNTIPGFTSISMYPQLWEKSGLKLPDLIDRLVELGFERFEAL